MEPRFIPSQRRVLSASRRLPSLEPPSSAQLAGCTRRPLSASPRAAQLSSPRAHAVGRRRRPRGGGGGGGGGGGRGAARSRRLARRERGAVARAAAPALCRGGDERAAPRAAPLAAALPRRGRRVGGRRARRLRERGRRCPPRRARRRRRADRASPRPRAARRHAARPRRRGAARRQGRHRAIRRSAAAARRRGGRRGAAGGGGGPLRGTAPPRRRAAAGGGCKHVLGVLIEVGGATKRERNLGALAHDRLGTNGRRALLEVMRRLGGSFVLGDSRVDGNLLAVDAGAALGEAGGADADEVVGRPFVRGASFLRGPRTDGALFDSLGESIARRDVVFASFVAHSAARARAAERRPPTAPALPMTTARICACCSPCRSRPHERKRRAAAAGADAFARLRRLAARRAADGRRRVFAAEAAQQLAEEGAAAPSSSPSAALSSSAPLAARSSPGGGRRLCRRPFRLRLRRRRRRRVRRRRIAVAAAHCPIAQRLPTSARPRDARGSPPGGSSPTRVSPTSNGRPPPPAAAAFRWRGRRRRAERRGGGVDRAAAGRVAAERSRARGTAIPLRRQRVWQAEIGGEGGGRHRLALKKVTVEGAARPRDRCTLGGASPPTARRPSARPQTV